MICAKFDTIVMANNDLAREGGENPIHITHLNQEILFLVLFFYYQGIRICIWCRLQLSVLLILKEDTKMMCKVFYYLILYTRIYLYKNNFIRITSLEVDPKLNTF